MTSTTSAVDLPLPSGAVARPRRLFLPHPRRLLPVLEGLVLPAVLLGAWALTSHQGWLPAQILPGPGSVLDAFRELLASGELGDHIRASLSRVILGFALGGGLGLLLGVAMGVSRAASEIIEPVFVWFAQVPPIALAPLLILLVGIDEALKVLIVAKAAMIPLAVNTAEGVRNVPRQWREVGRVFGFSPARTVFGLVLPAALPTVFSGVRTGLTHAWLTLVAVELIASTEGLGYLMVWGRQLFQLEFVLLSVVVIALIGFALDRGLNRIEARIGAWR
ncbi:ABC transporter permease [Xanthobacter agilis]|uniref:Sulfonate transport system permease protein n=1 Tax=Xanthobacter agilis TaxID=47492 RepID=A0ABU0LBP5_XANAG|nr:ABC transporter permease [Xanthobacter agilis]MDQ0504480.1 sulfonate transport system permease protein [Xanthobacter agilis]